MKDKAVFLDRDWTLNHDWWYLHKKEDIKVLSWAKEWLTLLRSMWYKLIMITNQSWIWRWYYTLDDCNNFNNELQNQLWIKFDWIYICPHSPDENCKCRKPKTLLIKKAIKDFSLDIKKCFFIGDKESDIQTGINAGCKTVLINNSQYECNLTPDYLMNSLLEFAKIIK